MFYRRQPMFSCIRLRKRQQCCKPKIGGETLVKDQHMLKEKIEKERIEKEEI